MSLASPPEIKPRRADLENVDNLCEYCTAKCCRYFALPIETPEEAKDFDFIRWYLLHDRASVFVDDEVWYLLVHTTCKHLGDDHRCGIYETRPEICRDYTTKQCEFEDDWCYDQYFESPEQIHEYAQALFPAGVRKKGKHSLRSPKPNFGQLPII
ncbi:MAG: YkgJ family cysteine cluster protein [Planctomycetota bacterium]